MSGYIWEYLQAGSVLIGDLTINSLLVAMISVIGGFEVAYEPWGWIIALALQLLLGLLILHHGSSWTVYLIVQGAMIVAEVVLACLMFTSSVYIKDLRVWYGMIAAGAGMHAAFVAYIPPKDNLIVGYVDVLTGLMICYLYFEYVVNRTDPALWAQVLVTMVYELVVVCHLRTEPENGHRISGASTMGKAALIALPAAFLAIALIAAGSAAGQIHSLLDVLLVVAQKVWAVIYIIMEGFARVLAAVILLIARILPGTPRYLQESAAPVMDVEPDVLEEVRHVLPSWVFPLIFGIIAAALIIWGLYLLRNTHVRITLGKVKKRRVERKSYLFPGILDRLKKAAAFIAFEWDCLRNRRSLQGLYLLAERRGRRLKVKKTGAESPSAYLRRLEDKLRENPDIPEETGKALLSLACLLDDMFYGGRNVKPDRFEYNDYARLIRQIR